METPNLAVRESVKSSLNFDYISLCSESTKQYYICRDNYNESEHKSRVAAMIILAFDTTFFLLCTVGIYLHTGEQYRLIRELYAKKIP